MVVVVVAVVVVVVVVVGPRYRIVNVAFSCVVTPQSPQVLSYRFSRVHFFHMGTHFFLFRAEDVASTYSPCGQSPSASHTFSTSKLVLRGSSASSCRIQSCVSQPREVFLQSCLDIAARNDEGLPQPKAQNLTCMT